MARKLTSKQRLWVEAYLETWNGTDAARRAGYSGSYETLASIGSENLRKPKLRVEIEKRLTEAALSANEVLARLSEQAKARHPDFFDRWGRPNWEEIRARGHLVKKVYNTLHGWRVELHDNQKALELMARHHGLLVDRIQIDDWRSKIIEGLRSGQLDPADVRAEFDDDLAQELFESAGVRVSTS